ncbi:uncharacterized protein [Rutidosis leptorrhynchoides]|uniref:uncharacterized protein n=1 Tax=Rutidosis leptorrhynchoides TaxID=125765 RepID=UPI003A992403
MTGDESYDNAKRLEKEAGPARGRNFLITTDDAKKSNDVVLGTFLVNSKSAKVLFDSGSDMSYISLKYAATLDCPLCDLDSPLQVKITDGMFSAGNGVYKNCVIDFRTKKFDIDLVPITLGEFDVVVGMDWLDHNRANLDCHDKFVRERRFWHTSGVALLAEEQRFCLDRSIAFGNRNGASGYWWKMEPKRAQERRF